MTSISIFLALCFISSLAIVEPPQREIPMACLIENPVTEQCLLSINANDISDGDAACYLCIISHGMGLTLKTEQFCEKGRLAREECGFIYFEELIKKSKFQLALEQQYALFFYSPFTHNENITRSITSLTPFLEHKQIGIKLNQHHFDDLQKGILSYYLTQFSASQKYFEKYEKQHGFDMQESIAFLMARVLEKQGKYYEGLQYITKRINSMEKQGMVIHGYFHHIRGNFLMHHVQFGQAIDEFNKANHQFKLVFNLEGGFSFTHYNIGICHIKLGNPKAALPAFQRAVISSDSAIAINALGSCHESIYKQTADEEHLNQALHYYGQSIRQDENSTVSRSNIAVLLMELGRYQQAETHILKCLQINAEFKNCKFGLIKLYYLTSRTTLADQVIASFQIDQQLLGELGSLLNGLNDHRKALSFIEQFKQKITSAFVMEMKGTSQFALEKYPEAEASFYRAIFLGAKTGHVYYNLGLSREKQSKYESAEAAYVTSNILEARQETATRIKNCQEQLTGQL